MSATAIDGAGVLADRQFRCGTVLVEGATITAVAFQEDERHGLRARAVNVVDGNRCWLVPGLVDAHTHAYGTLLRGTQSALPLELWSLFTIAYGYGLDEDAIAIATALHAAECMRSGITGIVDHFPHVAHANAALEAHEATGMRVLFAPFFQDLSDYDLLAIEVPPEIRGLAAVTPLNIPAYEARFAEWAGMVDGGSGRVQLALGPNAPQRCSPEAWRMWSRLRERYGVPVHTHALETRAQVRIAQQRWPGGMIAALDDAGLLDAGLSLAHAVWTTPAEQTLLARRGVAVVHNPLSNLALGSGIMPLREYLVCGATVALGTDASNCGGRHDLFETMRTALLLPRVSEPELARWPDATTVFDCATANGMRVLGFDGVTGIAPGAPADLVLVRRATTTNAMSADTLDGFVMHAGRDAVEAVMIAGQWVMRDDAILTFDEARLLAALDGVHADLAERAESANAVIAHALPRIAAQLERWQQPLA